MHPDEFDAVEPVAPRIVAEVQRALTNEVERINHGMARSGRRVLTRLLKRDDLPPIEAPGGGWEIYIRADRNGELSHGQLGMNVLQRVAEQVNEVAKVEAYPRMEGRQMLMVLAPK